MDSVNPTPPGRPLGSIFGAKFFRYRALLRRQWWVLALTVGLGLAVEAFTLFKKPDLYESIAEIMVKPEITALDPKVRESFDSLYGDTMKMLQGADILDAAKKRVELEAPQLSGSVEITPSVAPRTSIFTVSGVGTNPEYTRRYVDAVITEFIAFRRSQVKSDLLDSSGEISSQLKTVRTALEAQQGELQKFIKENDMQFWKQRASKAAETLGELRNRETERKTELHNLQNLTPEELLTVPSLKNAPAKNDAAKPAPAGSQQPRGGKEDVFNAELYTQYLEASQQLFQKQAELEERSTVWKPKHPRLQALQAEVARLQRRIEVIKAQNYEASKSRIAAVTAELKSIGTMIDTWTKEVQEASVKDAEFHRLESAVTRSQALEDKLLDKLTQVDPNSGINNQFKVIRKATPASPVSKGTAKHLLIGLFGGLAVGGLILFFVDRSDDRVASSTEVIQYFSEPILGQIPNVIESRRETGLPLLEAEDERFAYAEAFRSLRSSLIFMPNQEELKSLLVTSAIPNEGKSTIAANLGITMSAAGARVLLIDADLRRGDLASLFDTDGRFGLSNVLRGECPWKSTVQTTKYPTLFLIPRGPVTNQSGELLLRPELEKLLEEFKAEYDLVIFNTAPILATDDTPTLAPHFDGALMVVRAQFTSAKLTQNSLNALYQRQVNVLGLILNCVDTETPDYYYYRYPKYYAA